MGRGSGGLDSGNGMEGGGHGQLWPQCGEFSNDVGGDTMLGCRIICAPKRRTRSALCGSGSERGAKEFIDDPDWGPECAAGRPT